MNLSEVQLESIGLWDLQIIALCFNLPLTQLNFFFLTGLYLSVFNQPGLVFVVSTAFKHMQGGGEILYIIHHSRPQGATDYTNSPYSLFLL